MYDENEFGYDEYAEDDPMQAAMEADPAAFIADVVNSTVAQAAPLISQHIQAQVQQQQQNEISQGLGDYAIDQAVRSMRAAYGDDWDKWGARAMTHLQNNPHLIPHSLDPQHALDALDGAFLSARAEGERQETANEWNKIKASGKKDYWEPAS